jgi:hypothetical protein
MTWEEKVMSDESIAASMARDMEECRAQQSERIDAMRILHRSENWLCLVQASMISYALLHDMEIIMADAFLRGAQAAKRVAEIEALEALSEK